MTNVTRAAAMMLLAGSLTMVAIPGEARPVQGQSALSGAPPREEPAEREAEARRDPIVRFVEFLKTNGLATDGPAATTSRASLIPDTEADSSALRALYSSRSWRL